MAGVSGSLNWLAVISLVGAGGLSISLGWRAGCRSSKSRDVSQRGFRDGEYTHGVLRLSDPLPNRGRCVKSGRTGPRENSPAAVWVAQGAASSLRDISNGVLDGLVGDKRRLQSHHGPSSNSVLLPPRRQTNLGHESPSSGITA